VLLGSNFGPAHHATNSQSGARMMVVNVFHAKLPAMDRQIGSSG
jgi:hypothetical protein